MKILVVGGGVAGISLAFALKKNNCDVKLIDKNINHSSKIAAGIMNPVVFKRLTTSWLVEDIKPFAEKFYQDLENLFGSQILHHKPMRRFFSTEFEGENWKNKELNSEVSLFVKNLDVTDKDYEFGNNTLGTGQVVGTCYVKSKHFMELSHAYLQKEGILKYDDFDFSKFDAIQKCYNKEIFDKVVFAEGYEGANNPFFSYLPFKGTKGEILTIESEEIPTEEILNRRCFVLPISDNTFRLGATFTWDNLEPTTTESAREELLGNLATLTNTTVRVKHQDAGIRPTSADRRPFIGPHPENNDLFIFNGLGTKGYMIAPYFANQLVEHILTNTDIHPEADIQRFYRKHYPKQE